MFIESLRSHFRERNRAAPVLSVIEEPQLPPIGPFRVSGVIMRSQRLSPEHYGDTIWHNAIAIVAIDASAPQGRDIDDLFEIDMVSDLLELLPAVFDGTPLTPDRLLDASDAVLTSPGRTFWCRAAEFGFSFGGVYYVNNQLTCFSIGTNALYINGRRKIAPGTKFYNPYPKPKSNKVGVIVPTVLTLSPERVMSVIICTDGVDLHYSLTSNRPTAAPHAKELTIIRLER